MRWDGIWRSDVAEVTEAYHSLGSSRFGKLHTRTISIEISTQHCVVERLTFCLSFTAT